MRALEPVCALREWRGVLFPNLSAPQLLALSQNSSHLVDQDSR
jgi:hypothetical protein